MRKFLLVSALAVLAALTSATQYPLYAGQNQLVGSVDVTNDATTLTVIYTLTGSWKMTSSHLAVSNTVTGIPHTKKGSPIPGQFPYSATYDPAVTTATYNIPKPSGSTLYIAAHAVVSTLTSGTMTIVSGNDTIIADRVLQDPYPTEAVTDWGPYNAEVPVAVGIGDPAIPSVEAYLALGYPDNNSLWDQLANTPFYFGGTGADWVWFEAIPTNWNWNEQVKFQHAFNIPGDPLSAELTITCDNHYHAWLNGSDGPIGDPYADDIMTPGRFSWLLEDSTKGGWQTVEQYNVVASLVNGANMLEVLGTNIGQPWQQWENPAGLIYKLVVSYLSQGSSETGWGGTNAFPGGNWANYIIYTPS